MPFSNSPRSSVNVSTTITGLAYVLPSGDTSGVTDTTLLNNAVAASKYVGLVAGSYYWLAGVIRILTSGVHIHCAGENATIINGVGTGTIFYNHDAATEAGSGSFDGGFTMDLSACGAGSVGIDIGDITYYHVDGIVQNATGTGSVGWLVRNTSQWTERLHGNMYARHNTQGIVFRKDAGGTNSMARPDLSLWITTGDSTFDGVVIDGIILYGGPGISVNGNWASGASNVNPTSGLPSSVIRFMNSAKIQAPLTIDAECPAGAATPMSLYFDASTSVIFESEGRMSFDQAGDNFTASNWPGSGSFLGPISGGGAILQGLSRLANTVKLDAGLSLLRGNAQSLLNGQTILTAGLTGVLANPGAGASGIVMQAGTLDGQVMKIINQSASGSITFAIANSNVADGGSDVIAPLTARSFIWSKSTSLWYREG